MQTLPPTETARTRVNQQVARSQPQFTRDRWTPFTPGAPRRVACDGGSTEVGPPQCGWTPDRSHPRRGRLSEARRQATSMTDPEDD